jgi:hypothetical protein
MPTKNPRVQVVLDRRLYEGIRKAAKARGLSMSLEIRDIVREAVVPYAPRASKPFKGKHVAGLIGRYHSGSRRTDHDDVLAAQVHG